ncbi:hypothetical protein SISSUDRAFT_993502 [Sistotremastrum suecicum HHB10207 ss-3]|uniref:Fe2OG dioxygenase domain-containing protein n=1 Tax=Sistotremastrum suecicum HHB10207 ss-3 TaxID=1314776 RepID=A0A165Y9T6_9AGAM|nr:hypothetical protein SISSUDRAFT_993502 [Sistotremastrum suecicum HHB10207 ss-3]
MSPEYRKALKNHRRSTQGKPDKAASDDWTAFRKAEKKYKAKFPPPSLDDVLDLSLLLKANNHLDNNDLVGRADVVQVEEIRCEGNKRAFILPTIPGLVLLPSFLSEQEQQDLIQTALSDVARHSETNLHTHYDIPPRGLWDIRIDPASSKQLIPPKVVTEEADFASEPQGPRRLVDNPPVNVTNLAIINSVPKAPAPPSPGTSPSTASELLERLRWANLGYFYHWGTKSYDLRKTLIPIPERIQSTCKNVVQSINWHAVWWNKDQISGWDNETPDWQDWKRTYQPDAGIVNFYQPKDTLMGHVDRSEVSCTTPLVSISIGNSAIFLIGGQTRDVEPLPILLRSGDVIVMSGPFCRRAYHGIPKILPNTSPSKLFTDSKDNESSAYRSYLQSTRININVRQVFPRGYQFADIGLEGS